MRVSVAARPGGYRVRVFSLRPPHFPAESSTVAVSDSCLDPAAAVREILEVVQHYMGGEWGRAWSGGGWLPDVHREGSEPTVTEIGPQSGRGSTLSRSRMQ